MLDMLVAVDLIERQMNARFDGDGKTNAPKRRGRAKRLEGTADPSKPTDVQGRSAGRPGLVVRSANRLRLG